MRVLFLVGRLDAGGLERYVTRIALEAKARGDFEPVIGCLTARSGLFLKSLEQANVEVFSVKPNWYRNLSAWNDLTDKIRGVSPSIIHSQYNFALLQQFLAVRFASRAPFCVTERNCYSLTGLARLRRIIQFYAVTGLGGHYSANSAAVARHLAEMVAAPVRSIRILNNGIDEIPNDPAARSAIRKQLGWDENTFGILYTARMATHKGHLPFLAAFKDVKDQHRLKCCFLGDGPMHAAIQKEIGELQLEDAVSMPGIVHNTEDYLQAADIFALFSEHEGMPNAILEAMAAGKAIVASDVGAVSELLDGGQAGLLVRYNDVEGLRAGLEMLVTDSRLREQFARRASARAATSFSLDQAYHTLVSYYQQWLAGNAAITNQPV